MAPPSSTRKGGAPGRHVYDAIVIGGQLGGILSTALLARRGLQVLHVPHDGLTEQYTHGEVSLPNAPLLMPPVKSLPALEELLNEIGVVAALSRSVQVTPLQLLEKNRWYELSHDEKRRGPELARAFGDAAEAFDERTRRAQAAGDTSDAFFAAKPDLPPDGLFARWKFKRMLSRFSTLDTDTPLKSDELLRKLLPFTGAADVALGRARTLGRTLVGPAIFPGGREGLWQALATRARELGAEILTPNEPIERLTPEGGGVGVRLAHHDAVYRAGVLLAAMDLDVLSALVPDKQRKAADKIAPAVQSSRALFTLNLVLPESALPRGLGTLALLDAPSLGGAMLLQVLPASKPEQRVLSVSVPANASIRTQGETAINALKQQVHAELARVMPFTKAHVTLESTPWLDAPRVVAGAGEPAPLFELPDTAWLGVAGFTTQSPWKRILLASRQVLPGLGLEGEVMAALRAVRTTEAVLKKNDPLKARKSA